MDMQLGDVLRQGDVLLIKTKKSTGARFQSRKSQPRPKGVTGIVCAAGEATGHHHRVTELSASLYLDGGERILKVGPSGATLVHEEHDPIAIPEGEYLIRRQREYEPPKTETAAPTRRYVYD